MAPTDTVQYQGLPARASIFASQPFKFVYGVIAYLVNIAQLPFWVLYYVVPRMRPIQKWSLQTAVFNHIVKRTLYHNSVARIRTPFSLAPGAEADQWEVVHPSRKDIYRDILLIDHEAVRPDVVGGTWYPAGVPPPAKGAKPETTILHFHGGAFVTGDPRKGHAGYAGAMLSSRVAPRVVMAGYRLASNPNGHFPAALQDAVTWYQHLLDLGIPGSRIVLSGDSAGGNLALGLLRYVDNHRDIFPEGPAAILLWSPWVNLKKAFHPQTILNDRHYPTDFITANFAEWGATQMCLKRDAADPWLSPSLGPFVTSTPIFLQAGTVELLYDDIMSYYGDMTRVEEDGRKNEVELHLSEDCNHDIILLGAQMGFQKAVDDATKHAYQFVEKATAKAG